MKKVIVILSVILFILTSVTVLVILFNKRENQITSDNIEITEEDFEEQSKAVTSEIYENMSSGNTIEFTDVNYSSVSDDVRQHLSEYISEDEFDCVCTLIEEWTNSIGSTPNEVLYVQDESTDNIYEVAFKVACNNNYATIHYAYDYDANKVIGYLKTQE